MTSERRESNVGVEMVISGGQTGADQAGWRAAKAVGIACSGWMPKGFLTEDGPHPEFADLYGACEMATSDYPSRTRANVASTEALLWFGNPYSPGGKLTMRLCCEATISQYVVIHPGKNLPEDVAEWLEDQFIGGPQIRTLMVAGNRESSAPGIGEWVERYLTDVFRFLAASAVGG